MTTAALRADLDLETAQLERYRTRVQDATDMGLPDVAEALYERFVKLLEEALVRPVPTGRFGADMEVTLVGDGPVTLWLERGPRDADRGAA